MIKSLKNNIFLLNDILKLYVCYLEENYIFFIFTTYIIFMIFLIMVFAYKLCLYIFYFLNNVFIFMSWLIYIFKFFVIKSLSLVYFFCLNIEGLFFTLCSFISKPSLWLYQFFLFKKKVVVLFWVNYYYYFYVAPVWSDTNFWYFIIENYNIWPRDVRKYIMVILVFAIFYFFYIIFFNIFILIIYQILKGYLIHLNLRVVRRFYRNWVKDFLKDFKLRHNIFKSIFYPFYCNLRLHWKEFFADTWRNSCDMNNLKLQVTLKKLFNYEPIKEKNWEIFTYYYGMPFKVSNILKEVYKLRSKFSYESFISLRYIIYSINYFGSIAHSSIFFDKKKINELYGSVIFLPHQGWWKKRINNEFRDHKIYVDEQKRFLKYFVSREFLSRLITKFNKLILHSYEEHYVQEDIKMYPLRLPIFYKKKKGKGIVRVPLFYKRSLLKFCKDEFSFIFCYYLSKFFIKLNKFIIQRSELIKIDKNSLLKSVLRHKNRNYKRLK